MQTVLSGLVRPSHLQVASINLTGTDNDLLTIHEINWNKNLCLLETILEKGGSIYEINGRLTEWFWRQTVLYKQKKMSDVQREKWETILKWIPLVKDNVPISKNEYNWHNKISLVATIIENGLNLNETTLPLTMWLNRQVQMYKQQIMKPQYRLQWEKVLQIMPVKGAAKDNRPLYGTITCKHCWTTKLLTMVIYLISGIQKQQTSTWRVGTSYLYFSTKMNCCHQIGKLVLLT